MAFVLETGAGLSNANAYIDVDYFNTHHIDRGEIEIGDYENAEIEQHIIRATDYVDKRFGLKYVGFKRSRSQSLEWPRVDAYDDDDYALPDIPLQLQKAVAEYTLISLQIGRNLAPIPGLVFPILDPDAGTTTPPAGGTLTGDEKTVGPISIKKSYSGKPNEGRPVVSSGLSLTQSIPEYPQADAWMQAIIKPTSSRELRRG
jgi:hypothetical protein